MWRSRAAVGFEAEEIVGGGRSSRPHPGRRIIAFYGNPLSKRMGILGEFASEDMLRKLDAEVTA